MERDKVWNKLISEKYGVASKYDLSQVDARTDSSHIVRSILQLKALPNVYSLISRECFQWKVGNGELALFWEDQ